MSSRERRGPYKTMREIPGAAQYGRALKFESKKLKGNLTMEERKDTNFTCIDKTYEE